jgi:lipopolysaccharide assembly protein A
MRWLYLAIIVLFSLAALVFILDNREIVTLSFLGFSVRSPFAILIAVIYVLGAATGGSLFALLRRSYKGSRQNRPS